jgi:hypothetical protein
MEEIPLGMFDAVLSENRPFGNTGYIHDQLHLCYKRRLDKISRHLRAAGRLLDALSQADSHTEYRVMGDTIVRCAVQHALKQLETKTEYGFPLDECEQIFLETSRHLEAGNSCGPLERGSLHVNRLGSQPYHGWVWSEEHSDDVFGRCFRRLIQTNYGGPLCSANADQLEILRKAAQLLGELLPLLSRSALSHTQLIAIFPPIGVWKGRASSSTFRVSGTVFLNGDLVQNPWWVAEHLLHESLHQKLYDFRHGHSLLARDSSPALDSSKDDTVRVPSPWNTPDLDKRNLWDTHRVVAAFHVYVHLALLSQIAEQRATELEPKYGPMHCLPKITESRKALDRAHYLGEQLKEVCSPELGLAGKRLTDWLLSILAAIDACPPPEGSFVHLLLDRYLTEAKRVEYFLGNPNPDKLTLDTRISSDLVQQLSRIVKCEVEDTRSVLSAVRADADLNKFNDALTQYSDEELGMKFVQLRRLIAKTLLDVSPDGYGVRCTALVAKPADNIVNQMVENSSLHLSMLLANSKERSAA